MSDTNGKTTLPAIVKPEPLFLVHLEATAVQQVMGPRGPQQVATHMTLVQVWTRIQIREHFERLITMAANDLSKIPTLREWCDGYSEAAKHAEPGEAFFIPGANPVSIMRLRDSTPDDPAFRIWTKPGPKLKLADAV